MNQIPIFVALREWQGEGDLGEFIARQFEICEFPDAAPFLDLMLTYTDYGLVLFDGLDEIPQEGERRTKAIAVLRDFARQYPRAQVLITCRNAASDYNFEGFKYVEISDFNEGQMYAFVRKWFKAAGTSAVAERFWSDLNKDENSGIREMGGQPLLLTLLCLNYQETLHFPQRRVEIYEEALDALLKKWDSSRQIARDRVYKQLSLGRKKQLFARIAATFFEKGKYFIPQRELETVIVGYMQKLPNSDMDGESLIDGEAILRAIEAQHGILVQCAHRVYTFAHLTFQEYYTARYTVDHARRGTLKSLFLLHRVTAPRWREVILLTASMLDEADDFFAYFLFLLEDLIRSEIWFHKFLSWVAHKSKSVDIPCKFVAIRGYYAYLALDLAFVNIGRNILLPTLDLGLGDVRDLAGDLACDLGFDPEKRFAFDDALDNSLARTFKHACNYTFDDTRTPTLAHICAFTFNHARELAVDLESFYSVLNTISLPNESSSLESWHNFVKRFQKLMIKHRNIGQSWNFPLGKIGILRDYFIIANLLVECLDIAYIVDRTAIEARLLQPPLEPKGLRRILGF